MGKYEAYDKTNRFYLALSFKEFEVFQIYGMSGTRVKCILWQYDTLYKKIGESL